MQEKGLILVVEDEMLIAEHISRIIINAGYTCICVTYVKVAFVT